MAAALVLLAAVALVVGWEVLCLGEVVRADRVRFLPRWAWAVACLIFIPFGGILYLLAGRVWIRSGTRGPGQPVPGTAGMTSSNVAPWPLTLSTRTEPWWASAMTCTMGRPSPNPPASRLR